MRKFNGWWFPFVSTFSKVLEYLCFRTVFKQVFLNINLVKPYLAFRLILQAIQKTIWDKKILFMWYLGVLNFYKNNFILLKIKSKKSQPVSLLADS